MASGSIFDNDLLFTQHKHSGCMANKGLMAAHKQQNDCERGKRLHLSRTSLNQPTDRELLPNSTVIRNYYVILLR